MNKVALGRIPPFRKISMERAFNGTQHSTIKGVALHAGVPSPLARAFLVHLIKEGKIKESNKFALRLKTKK